MLVIRAVLLALASIAGPAAAQEPETVPETMPESAPEAAPGDYVINLRDAEIRVLAEQVSDITGRTLVLDPAVQGEVTVISAEPLDQAGVWDLFQSVLRSQGFAALQSGSIWRVLPQELIRESAGTATDGEGTGRLDVVTRLVQLESFPAATAAAALRPLVASFGYIEALPETNALVITDTAENIERIEAIAESLDEGGGSRLATIFVRNAAAADLATAIEQVYSGAEGSAAPRISVDPRSNALLVRGSLEQTADVRRLTESLDLPGRSAPSPLPVTRVYRLRYAEAASLVEVLRGVIGSGALATNPVAAALAPQLPPQDPAIAEGFGVSPIPAGVRGVAFPAPDTPEAEDITVQPAPDINAVVVRARAEFQADLAGLIAELDQRRPQVLIEAAIVEISGDISEQLGIQLGLGGAAPSAGFAATSFPTAGLALDSVLDLLDVPASAGIAPAGLSIGLSRQDRYGILIQALSQSSKANLLSTPSITTLDNQPAEIVVAQNVPFRTGSFLVDDADNPFTTIEREDVGITLRVLPRVSDGDAVVLEVSQEVSSLVGSVAGAADLITNRRMIQTTVLADNRGTIVLGGLITDDRNTVESKVPGLGDIPVVGRLFRADSENATKRTLFVFLRPTILRSRAEVSTVSAERYQRLRSIDAGSTASPASPAAPRAMRRLPVEIDGLY